MYSTCIHVRVYMYIYVYITFNDTNSLHDNVTSVGYRKCVHSH